MMTTTTSRMARLSVVLSDMLDAAQHVGLPEPLSVGIYFGEVRIQVNADDLRAWIEWTDAKAQTPELSEHGTHFHATARVDGVRVLLTAVRLGEES